MRRWPGATPARVAVADFHELVARRLKSVLESAGWLVVAHGVCAHALRGAFPELMVLNLATLASGELATLATDHPGTRFAVLGEHVSRGQTQALVSQGAAAVLALATSERDLVAALRLTSRGLWVGHATVDPLDSLTHAERRVYRLLCCGLSNADIARQLQLGQETIRTHARRIYAKLGVNGRHELR